jgi:hypothetical protein
MTEHNPYPAQVADLISQAFATLGEGLERETQPERDEFLEEARSKRAAAQAVATLAHAHETRILALATLAGLDPVKVEAAGPLPQEAFAAAAVALGLVEGDADDESATDPLIAADLLAAKDAETDAELGDLP